MTTLAHRIDERVQRAPERRLATFRALTADGRTDLSMTYGELWRSASAFAERLDGVPVGNHILLVMPLGLRLLDAHLGVQLAGLVASIFTHPSEKIAAEVYARNLRHVVEQLRPAAIVTTRAFLDVVTRCCAGIPCVIVIAEDVPDTTRHEPPRWKQIAGTAPVIIQHSSGSTGLQKSVVLTHDMVRDQCESYGRFIGLSPDTDHICSWLPLYHDMGLFTAWLMPVLQNVPVSFIDPFEWVRQPLSLLEMIGETGGTLCWQPNFAFKLLAARGAASAHRLDLSSMRGFVNCSEPVTSDAMREFGTAFAPAQLDRSSLWTCYAMAENAFAVTASGGPSEAAREIAVDPAEIAQGRLTATASGARTLVSCGRPVDGSDIRIVDDAHQTLSEGAIGEIAIRSRYLMRGYYRADALTDAAIDANGWYYSGDLGAVLDGRLYVTGRKKDLLIVAGRNFYPQDIEDICYGCAGVIPGRAVALGQDDVALGTQKVVVIVESHLTDAKDIARLSAGIRQTVLERLDCAVSHVRVVPHMWLLKTSSGKIARQPNLDKHLREPEAKPVSVIRPARASLLEVAVWAFVVAFAAYAYTLIFLLGDNQSWNIYARF